VGADVPPRTNAVLVTGGRWHDFEYARAQLLVRLAEYGHVRTTWSPDYSCLEALADADLLVTYTCDLRPTPEQQQALVAFVERGGRWLALHATNSAIDPPEAGGPRIFTTPRVLGPVADVLGTQFLAHPPIAPFTVEVTRPHHPMVAGIGSFEITDELYVCEHHGEIEVLLHTDFNGPCRGFAEGEPDDRVQRPVLYFRPFGAGTVCYFTLGHCRGRFDVQDLGIEDLGRTDRVAWEVPEYRVLLDRCVGWGVSPG